MADKEDCQLCDRIREDDPKFETMNKLVAEQGCTDENNALTDCLRKNKNSWRLCAQATTRLATCVKNSKSN